MSLCKIWTKIYNNNSYSSRQQKYSKAKIYYSLIKHSQIRVYNIHFLIDIKFPWQHILKFFRQVTKAKGNFPTLGQKSRQTNQELLYIQISLNKDELEKLMGTKLDHLVAVRVRPLRQCCYYCCCRDVVCWLHVVQSRKLRPGHPSSKEEARARTTPKNNLLHKKN